ncbi:MAG: phycobilisome rod-core linker polypeptide [Cyanobacteria bacterium]|nr:phycobilisome rod-core linker polypeptide [Cyanobacteriota bacterium]MDW8200215.1 phycobilisome rod-core linker polypeptide [Cyanobacteriota bacterium SKYGB_h_bin112]
MSLPLLTYPLSSQNQRVEGYEIFGDEQPRIYTIDNLLRGTEVDEIIWAAYRQVFNEQQILQHHRQVSLESQLRSHQITVQRFIHGLLLSDSFRRLNYECNSNYRFVEMCIQRVLGRNVYDNREKLAWSTVLATKGIQGFVEQLLSSEEYQTHFGENTVPYQRRRILPQRSQGEQPFARVPRYDQYYRNQLQALSWGKLFGNGVSDRSADVYRRVLFAVPTLSLAVLVATLIFIAAPK